MKTFILLFLFLVFLALSSCNTEDLEKTNGTQNSVGNDIIKDTKHDDTDADIYPGEVGENNCPAAIEVTNETELKNALKSARPGTTINISSGVYYGEFHVEVSGKEGKPIIIKGPVDRSAILDGNFDINSWQGVLTLESKHHIRIENLEIRNSNESRYGVLVGATSKSTDGCHNIELRNLLVHHVGEEIIKIQGKNTHDILIEDCIVHTNEDWSGIDVQGHWGGTPSYRQKPKRIIIRNNLIYNIRKFAGIGNEFADNIHVYNNIILGSPMGLDIGCGNYNVIHNNLITSYEHFNSLIDDENYTDIDLSRYHQFSESEINTFYHPECLDGIALSGNYMSLIFDNEITHCFGNGDLILSYDHWIDGARHNFDYENNINYGHRANLFFRNKIHDNDAYYTIREYNKQADGVSYDEMFFHNIFYNNNTSKGIIFEHSEGLLFFNNTIINGDNLNLLEESANTLIKNNIFYNSGYTISADSSGEDISSNHDTEDPTIFFDFAYNDYDLSTSSPNICNNCGEDLSNIISPRFLPFFDLYDIEYNFYDDFHIEFDFFKDINGNIQDGVWDIGAFVSPTE